MRRVTMSWLAILLCGVPLAARAEDITLTTYYPSPRGVYNELRTTNNAYLAMVGGGVDVASGKIRLNPDSSLATAPQPVNARVDIGLASIVGNCPTFSSYMYWDQGAGWRYTTDSQAGFAWGGCGNAWVLWTTPISGTGATGAGTVVPSMPERIHVTPDGNVGIGTTGPEVKLHIKQAAVGTAAGDRPASLYLGSNDNGNLRGMLGWSGSPPYFLIQGVEDAVAWRNVVLARDGGNVGIGTPSPQARLHVVGGNGTLTIDPQGNPSAVFFQQNGTNLGAINVGSFVNGYGVTVGQVDFYTTNTPLFGTPGWVHNLTLMNGGAVVDGNVDANDVNIRAFPGGARLASSLQPTMTWNGGLARITDVVDGAPAATLFVPAQGQVYRTQDWGSIGGQGSHVYGYATCFPGDVPLYLGCDKTTFTDPPAGQWIGGYPSAFEIRGDGVGQCTLRVDGSGGGGSVFAVSTMTCLKK